MKIEEEAAFLRSMLNIHITHSCFRATRNKKEENRQICVQDTMTVAIDLALVAFDTGAAAAQTRLWPGDAVAEKRAEIEALKEKA